MVRQAKISNRLAFTLVELIFAIVIIAITVLSLPIMTQVTQKGIEGSIAQEAIFAASAELMSATTYYWDSNSIADISFSHFSRVINGTSGAGDCNSTTNLRPGHIAQPMHRRCLDSNTTGVNVSGVNGLEDGAGFKNIFINTETLADGGTMDSTGYKVSYDSNITVNIIANNIKEITSIITNAQTGEKIVVLRTQSTNIGEIDYFKRSF